MIKKEIKDQDLLIKLRAKSKITMPGKLFQQSQKIKYEFLIARGVFILIHRSDPKLRGQRIFKSRMVNKVKGKETIKTYEKSRLVI